MKYTYQDITKLQNEAEVSFEIADKALKKSRGNFNKALYIAMKKKKRHEKNSQNTSKVNEVFKKVFAYRFIASKKNHTYINMRVWILLLIVFFFGGMVNEFAWFFLLPLIISFFFNVEYKLSNNIKKADMETVSVEPAKDLFEKDEELNINLSEEKITDDDEGYVKVEIDK